MSNGNSTTRATVSKQSFHYVAGLASGLFSAVLLQPADLLKTRVQQASNASNPRPLVNTLKQIFASGHPFRQLWRGTLPSALRTGVGSALYFGGLNALRSTMAQHGFGTVQAPTKASSVLPPLSNSANLLAGAVARAAAGFALMPVTVIKVRYESSLYTYRSLYSATKDIMSQEGLRGFFAGFGATAARDAPYAGLYVLFYEAGKRRMSTVWSRFTSTDKTGMNLKSSGSAAGINFVSAVLAAGTATVITNPFDSIKTRLQLFPQRYGNMVRAARIMLREEGVRSLFDGLALRMGRKAMSSALAWTVYEEIIRRAEIRWVQDKKVL